MIDETIWLTEESNNRVQATILKGKTTKIIEIYGLKNVEEFNPELEELINQLYPGWYVVASWI